ncbi:GDP-mannose 4,6-dehydratase, partial [Cutibacterium acnes]
MNKKAIVFGVTGQDGSYLADFLLKKNYSLIGASRGVANKESDNLVRLNIKNKIIFESVNIENFNDVYKIIEKNEP